MAVPKSDEALLNWANTFAAWIATGFASVGLSSAQSTAFSDLAEDYATKLAAWQSDPTRSKVVTAAKLASKALLLANARRLYDIVKSFPGTTDEQKTALGVHIDKTVDTQAPVLPDAPVVTVKRVYGRQFTLLIEGVDQQPRSAFGASGATVYSFVGTTPPAGSEGWISEGNTGKRKFIVNVPDDVPAGSKVFFAANWYNARHVSPGCTPVMSQVGVEGSMSA